MSATCTTRVCWIATAALLVGCPTRTRETRAPRAPPEVAVPETRPQPTGEERPYRIVPGESLLTMLVYPGGALARAGHSHVVASRDVNGRVYVHPQLVRSSFELRVPVARLTIDEPELRRQHGAAFAAEVPQSARDGTRENMLGSAVLDAAGYPEVAVRSGTLDRTPDGGLRAHVSILIKGRTLPLDVPLRYELDADELRVYGQRAIRHEELGLAPFTALLGALQVRDEMTLSFRIVARRETGAEGPRTPRTPRADPPHSGSPAATSRRAP